MKNGVVVIAGMTGVGKSRVAKRVAEKVGGELIGGDASQIYKGLKVLTNKEGQSWLMGHWDHIHKATSSKYAIEGRRVIREIHERGNLPIIEGGSGFYIHSVFNPKLLMPEEGFSEAHERAKKIMEENNYSINILKQYDPDNLLGVNDQFGEYKLVNGLAIALLGESKKQSIAEHIYEAENNQENKFFSTMQRRMFYIYANKEDLNEIIDKRGEQMVTKMGLFDDILDYGEEIQEFASNHKLTHPEDSSFFDILSVYNPMKRSSLSKIKQTYPITHSIGFMQSLEYLTTLKNINSLNLQKGKMMFEKRKAAKKFLREFKTSTHKYTKMQNTWMKTQEGPNGVYKILTEFSTNRVADRIVDLISMSDSEYEKELNNEEQILTSFDRTGHSNTLSFKDTASNSTKVDDFEEFLSSQESQTTKKAQMYEPKSNILPKKARLASFIELSDKAALRLSSLIK